MEDEYITIIEAARRIGMSDKTVRRAIRDGKLKARYPQPNRAEVSITDLEIWHTGLHIRPGETQDRLKALEAQIAKLTAHVATLESQLQDLQATGIRKKALPKTETTAPEGFTYLSDFCALHFIPHQAADDLFPHMIHGQKIKIGHRLYPMIGPKGQHDFYVQLHTRPDFRSCDNCPHQEHGHNV